MGVARAHTGVFDQGWVHVDGWRELVIVVVAIKQWVDWAYCWRARPFWGVLDACCGQLRFDVALRAVQFGGAVRGINHVVVRDREVKLLALASRDLSMKAADDLPSLFLSVSDSFKHGTFYLQITRASAISRVQSSVLSKHPISTSTVIRESRAERRAAEHPHMLNRLVKLSCRFEPKLLCPSNLYIYSRSSIFFNSVSLIITLSNNTYSYNHG